MKPEEQRIAIAEACGFIYDKKSECWRKGGGCFFMEDPHHLRQLPDYTKDLNAMHEAEETVKNVWGKYVKRLNAISDPACATASQRAEAFLRTLNLYTPT